MTHLYVNDQKDSKLVSIPLLNDVGKVELLINLMATTRSELTAQNGAKNLQE